MLGCVSGIERFPRALYNLSPNRLHGIMLTKITQACQKSFSIDRVPPVETYLTFCQLGWHFPVHGDSKHHIHKDKKHRFGNGTDFHCNEVTDTAKKMTEEGKDMTLINCAICASDTGRAIVDSQRDYVRPKWNGHRDKRNFKNGCQDFVDRWGSYCEENGVEMPEELFDD